MTSPRIFLISLQIFLVFNDVTSEDSMFEIFNPPSEKSEQAAGKDCFFPSKSAGRTCTVNNCDGTADDKVCSVQPGDEVRQFIIISCTCEDGYKRTTKTGESYCIDGTWLPELPECISEKGQGTTVDKPIVHPTKPSVPKPVDIGCEFPLGSERICTINGCGPDSTDPTCDTSPGVYARSFIILSCTCKEGYELMDSDVAYCGGGKWLPKVPECARKRSTTPKPVTSTKKPTGQKPSSTTTPKPATIAPSTPEVSTSTGCVISKSAHRKCFINPCQDECNEISPGKAVSQFDIVKCTCEDNYFPTTKTDKSLCVLGQWSPELLECSNKASQPLSPTQKPTTPVTYSPPSPGSYGYCTFPGAEPGRKCHIKGCTPGSEQCATKPGSPVSQFETLACACDKGYSLATSTESLCVLGNWSPSIAKCVKN